MKRKLLLALVTLTMVAGTWTSCTKSSSSGNNNSSTGPTTGGSMSAKISSKTIASFNFEATSLTGILYDSASTNKEEFLVEGIDNNQNDLLLYFPYYTKPGTYPLGSSSVSVLVEYVNSKTSTTYIGYSGNVTVASISGTNVQGSFSLKAIGANAVTYAVDTATITSGVFNANYTTVTIK